MKKILFTLTLIGFFGNYWAQTTTSFRKNYDISLFDIPMNSIEGLTPNTYIFAGIHAFNSSITAVDNVGVTTWSRRFSSGIALFIGDVKKDLAQNRYFVCGGVDAGPAFLMFLDANGNFISGRNFSIAQATGASFNRVIKTTDGGYLCVGTVTGYDPDGAGPEVQFSPVTHNPPECSSSQTESIQSPLIVKFDASGNHQWHQVFRYYVTSNTPANRIYNDASFVDVVEISDGYMAIGSYDVNNVFSRYDTSDGSSCGEDRTPTDAMIAKFTFAGAIEYHRQIDNPSNSTTQSSKSFSSASLTAAGLPLISAADGSGRPMVLMRFAGSGGWANPTWIRKYGASSFFGTYNPFQPGRFFETSDGNYAMWGFHINSLSFEWSNVLMKINTSGTIQWSRQYTNGLAVILPHGEQAADEGYIGVSYTLAGSGHNLHLIKTDPNGNTSVDCPSANVSVSNETPSYTWANPIYNSWNANTVTNGVFTPTVANITPTESIQCLTVVSACTPPTINTQPTNVTICSTGTANVSVAASAGPYQWQYNNGGTWTNVTNGTPAGFSFTNGTTNNMTINTSGAAQGTYQFRVVLGDPGCETISDVITITVPGATRLVPTGPQCSGTQLNFEAFPTTGATYAWTVTPPGGTSATPTSGSGQTFSFVPTNTNGSSVSFPVSVQITHNSVTCTVNFTPTILPTPTAPVVGTITQPTCATPTGSVALSGLPAGSWTITASPGGATQNGSGTTATFTGLNPSTSYTFTVTNSDGCTSTASTSAAINAAPTPPNTPVVGTITQPTCIAPTGSVQLSGLPAGSWTITATPGGATLNGSTSSTTFTGLTPGNYTFTVTNDAGCTSSATSNVTINAVPGAPGAPVVGTITQPSCSVATGSVDLSGLPAGSWTLTMSPGAVNTNGSGATTSISPLAAGTYTFTVTNDLGCTSVASANVVINTQPTTPTAPVLGTVTQPTCTEATGSVAISGLPSGSWTITASPGGATQNGSGTTATFTGLTTGTYTFTVSYADACTSTASPTSAVINTQPATPTAPITGTVTQPTCIAPTGSVELSGLPTGSWTITASPGGATLNGSGSSATFTGLAPGTNYTFTVTNSDGCTSTVSSSVAINTVPGAPTAPTAGTVTQPTCAVPSGTIIVDSPLGAQYTYSIDGTTFQAGTTFSGLAPGSYTITVLDNTSGCSSVSAATVTIDPVANAPVVTLVSSTDVTCNGDTDGELEISISGGVEPYTIVWNPNVGNTTSLDNLAAGSYAVSVTDDAGCSSSAIFTVGSPGVLLVNGTSTNVLCGIADGIITTAVTGGTAPYSYAWTPGGETTSSLSGLAAGAYSVQVIDENGCTASQNFTLATVGNLPVNIDPSYVEIEAGESVVLTASGGDNYVWSPATGLSCTNCPNPTATPAVTTVYYVTATDDNGCTGGDSSVVVIKMPCGDLFVPTIFSPNGTGPAQNNKLCVFGTKACIEDLKFQVYDRWGELVFETTDIDNCWDGNYKDKPMNSGIFVYRLYVKLYNNDEPIDVSGNTTLVR